MLDNCINDTVLVVDICIKLALNKIACCIFSVIFLTYARNEQIDCQRGVTYIHSNAYVKGFL